MLPLKFFSAAIIVIGCIGLVFPLAGQPLTLADAIEEGMHYNPQIARASHFEKAARVAFWQMISPENPGIFIEYEGIPRSTWGLSQYAERKMGIAQEFDFPLQYYFRGQWQLTGSRTCTAELQSMRNSVSRAIKSGFYRLLLLEQQQKLYAEIQNLTRQLYSKAEIKVQAGESSPYEALKVKVDLAEVEKRLTAIGNEKSVARQELAVLLGRSSAEALEITGELRYYPVQVALDSLKELALQHHPHLILADLATRRKALERKMAWTNLLPRIHLKYFYQKENNSFSEPAHGGEIGLSIPLWGWIGNQGQIRAASQMVYAAENHRESEQSRILLAVQTAFSRLQVAEQQVTNYQANTLQEVEELVRIATRSYEEGEMGYLEVTEALRTLHRTKAGYLEALFSFLDARAELEQAAGISLFKSH